MRLGNCSFSTTVETEEDLTKALMMFEPWAAYTEKNLAVSSHLAARIFFKTEGQCPSPNWMRNELLRTMQGGELKRYPDTTFVVKEDEAR